MAQVFAVPTYKTRRRMMLDCGVYYPHIVPQVGGSVTLTPPEPPSERDEPDEKKR